MTIERVLRAVQVGFPQIYLACHTRHQRKRSTEHRLSQRDAAILAHLDQRVAISPARLAAHLGIARSTLSEALKRLIALGYARRSAGSSRTDGVLLADLGAAAIRDTSVLETERLRRAVLRLDDRERNAVTRGMDLLAASCRALGNPVRSWKQV